MLDKVDEVAGGPNAGADLSQTLAEAGVLPMFGFPTRVRYLHHKFPSGSTTPPKGVIDRDLEIAVSQFAPGAETPKDKAVHTAVGIGAWERYSGRWHQHPESAGAARSAAFLPRLSLHPAAERDPRYKPARCAARLIHGSDPS